MNRGGSPFFQSLITILAIMLGAFAVQAQTHSGRATGVNSTVTTGSGSATIMAGDTCPLPGVGGTITTTVPSSSVPGAGTTGSITSTTSGTLNSSVSSTTVNNVNFTLPTGVTVRANSVSTETQCSCCPGTTTAGCIGSTTIAGLDVRDVSGAPVSITPSSLPNQVVNLPGGGTLTINERINTPGAITVNGLHINVTSGGVTQDIVIAQSHSDLACLIATPTPAEVNVSGRIATAAGVPVYRATVTLTDSAGVQKISRTNQLGSFSFGGVTAGESYVLQATHSFYSFQPRVISVNEDVLDILLTPNLK